MVIISLGTFSCGSIADLRRHSRSSLVAMLATVRAVIYTHILAIALS